mmetsp:Transcript_2508/g.7142  ORF Transcript_2508/g.7142 Transcript_2508/m.7142 type:complete len:229 (-) Transcript_2508:280-966(-)
MFGTRTSAASDAVSPSSRRSPCYSTPPCTTTCSSPWRTRMARATSGQRRWKREWRRRACGPTHGTSCKGSRMACGRTSAPGDRDCPAGRNSGSRSPGRSSRMRLASSWTRPPAPWTWRRSAPSSTHWTACSAQPVQASHVSLWRIACPQCAAQTRSLPSRTALCRSKGLTRSSWRMTACTPAFSASPWATMPRAAAPVGRVRHHRLRLAEAKRRRRRRLRRTARRRRR